MATSTYLRALAAGEVPLVSSTIIEAADAIDAADITSPEASERVDLAMFAVAKARLQLARLIDYAVCECPELTDESPLTVDSLKAIYGLDEAFPRATDMATGMPLSGLAQPAPDAPDTSDHTLKGSE